MVFDCFIFFNELDLLQIRLAELAGVVDRFVIVEATKTFQGDPKPLYFAENKQRFARYLPQIEHVVIDFPATIDNELAAKSMAWGREQYQRDAIARGLAAARPEDFLLISDVDEIVAAASLKGVLDRWTVDSLTIFMMPMFYGFLDRRSTDPTLNDGEWALGPRLMRRRHFTTAQKIRNTRPSRSKRLAATPLGPVHSRLMNWIKSGIGCPIQVVRSSGWHFSSIGTWDGFRSKVAAFAHEECKQWDRYNSEAAFRTYIETTTSLFPHDRLPAYIRDNLADFGARGLLYQP